METTLSWIALGIGAIGTALGVILGHGEAAEDRASGAWTVGICTAVAAVILFFVTFLSHPPFTPGQMLGYGILIGGMLGAVAGLLAIRGVSASVWGNAVAVVTLPSLALLGMSVLLLLFPGYPQPPIGGFMIGAILASVLFRLVVPSAGRILSYGLAASVLGTTIMLAILRFNQIQDRLWWRAPLLVFGAVIIAQIVGAALAKEGRRFTIPALASSIVALGLTAVFAWRVFPQWPLLYVALAGVGTFAIVAWLASAVRNSPGAASLAALAVLALSAFGFRTLGGFGIGMALIAAWSIVLPALAATSNESEEIGSVRAVIYAMFIGIGMLFYRLFIETNADFLHGPDLRAEYTLVALGVGAILPFVVLSFFPIAVRRTAIWRTIGACFAGLFAAAVPLVILLLWGFKAALGLVIGTIVAEIFILLIYMGAVDTKETRYVDSAILVLAAQMSLLQFSGLISEFTESTRLVKVIILASLTVIALVWAWMSARLAREA